MVSVSAANVAVTPEGKAPVIVPRLVTPVVGFLILIAELIHAVTVLFPVTKLEVVPVRAKLFKVPVYEYGALSVRVVIEVFVPLAVPRFIL